MNQYNYEEWLSGHANRKTMMEKLERSLIPYELFTLIPFQNNRGALQGELEYASNRYHYQIDYDYECMRHEVYNAVLSPLEVKDKWHNPLLGYNHFKVVMNGDKILTIYSDHEDFFQRVIDMFELDDMAGLYANRSGYVNNMLARYILLRLIEAHFPTMQLITSIHSDEIKNIFVMAANANRTDVIMYAFSKHEAMDMAIQYDGLAPNLTIVYFFNQDFEHDGNTLGYESGCTHVISIRSFYNALPLKTMEKRLIEKRVLLLVSLLYNEHLEWHIDRVEKIVMNPPLAGESKRVHKSQRSKKRSKYAITGLPWWEHIPRTLLEDALNVLVDIPKTHADIFHYLCAANLVNAYVNQCKQRGYLSTRQLQRMYQAKLQIYDRLENLVATGNRNVKISINDTPSILINIRVCQYDFQFSFRGMKPEVVDRLKRYRVDGNGVYVGYAMQSIATALYQYSYLLRWE